MPEWVRDNTGQPLKVTDALLEWGLELMAERDIARLELAAERVAHRVTRKQLQEVTGMVLQ